MCAGSGSTTSGPSGPSGPSGISAPDALAIRRATSSEAPVAAPRNDAKPESSSPDDGAEEDDFHPGPRLWIIIIGLGVTLLLTALENTVAFEKKRIDIIVSDLVPLRLRGNYIGVILSIYGVGTTLGPFIGGSIVANTTWRWVFYLNLPIGGASLAVLFLFLKVSYSDHTTFAQKVRRIDFLGNAVLVASTVAVLYALAYAGVRYSWSSWHILVPLLLGLTGFVLFGYTQGGRFAAAEPVMPPRLFNTRTSVIISIDTFLNSALTFWVVFFLPVFFQAVELYGPQYSGVALLPMSLVAIPGSAVAAVSISRWGRYKPVHIAGFAVFMLGLGLFTLQNPSTTVAQWASYQCVCALGGGVLLNSQLPAFQAAVSERDQAAASAAWGFIRSIGWVWGVAIPATIFNTRIGELAGEVSDPVAAQMMASGGAYGSASAEQVKLFPVSVQGEIRDAYSQALQRVFQIAIAFAGVGFILSTFEHEIVLRERLDTEYGLKKEKNRQHNTKNAPAAAENGVTSDESNGKQ
ncbi:Efflux pump FUS6 [Apiospora rasikravindrae]|uniref:Efflux pump FUS6 n=1 Tax=Apiospora rasikravindrae TaxID=990691 RepID=A0ABR1SWD6_9PEZI